MKEILLVKYGEIILKGLNRGRFEDLLISNIKRALERGSFTSVRTKQAITYIQPAPDADIDEMINRLKRVFGIVYISRAAVLPKDMDTILKEGVRYLAPIAEQIETFKVETKRSDKAFPLNSPQISAALGAAVLGAFPHLRVDVINPDTIVRAEIRESDAYIYADIARESGPGGMPTGSNGRATLLLSGGIDSPVAGYMLAKRGVRLNAVHFFSPPYTGERAKEKVISLAKQLARYTGRFNLYIVPFTEQQLAIRDNCPEEHLTLIMRRMMMSVAEKIAKQSGSLALITGESLGQVASQTIHALGVTNSAVTELPVFRPLIGMDKDEIISLARKIGTFETSILPYEDCCTVFVPRHPATKPLPDKVLKSESKIDFAALADKAAAEAEWLLIEG